jgi:hypothetical protein
MCGFRISQQIGNRPIDEVLPKDGRNALAVRAPPTANREPAFVPTELGDQLATRQAIGSDHL